MPNPSSATNPLDYPRYVRGIKPSLPESLPQYVQDELQKIQGSMDNLAVASDSNAKALVHEETIQRVTDTEAVAAKILQLETDFTSNGDTFQAKLDEESLARSTADSALASRTLTLEASVNGANGTPSLDAKITSVDQASVTRDSALTVRIDALKSTSDGYQGAITTAQSTATNAQGAVSALNTVVSAALNPRPNLLQNGDFKEQLAFWLQQGSRFTPAYSNWVGSYLHIGTDASASGVNEFVSQDVNIDANVQYSISCEGSATAGIQLAADWINANDGSTAGRAITLPLTGANWSQRYGSGLSSVAPTGVNKLRVYLLATGGSQSADLTRVMLQAGLPTAWRDDASLNQISASVTSQSVAIANTNQTLASLTTSVNSQFGTTNANVTQVANTVTDANHAIASLSDTVTANYNNLSGSISDQAQIALNNNNSVSSRVTNVSNTVDGHTSSISSIQSAVNGLEGKYSLTVNGSGYVTGFSLNSGAGGSNFAVIASNFSITDGQTNKTPFSIANGTVTMSNVVVDTLKVNTAVVPGRAGASAGIQGTHTSQQSTPLPTPQNGIMTVNITMPVSGYIEVTSSCKQDFTNQSNVPSAPWIANIAVDGNVVVESQTSGTLPGDSVICQGSVFVQAGTHTVTFNWNAYTSVYLRQRSLFVKGFPFTG